MYTRTFAKAVITFALIFSFAFFAVNKTYAQVSVCQPSQGLFQRIVASLENLDIRRTVVNFIVSAVTDAPMQALVNGTTDDMVECMGYIKSPEGGAASLNINTDGCEDYDADYCAALLSTYDESRTVAGGPGSRAYYTQHANSRVSGSLVGLVNMAENATYQPVPVNLAYYVNREAQNIPFVGTAFAQSSDSFTGPFLKLTYDIWRIFRDLAYGVMAVIMIVVGIMIMTRKKINPQTAVTMQYALPRVIIALILITFSYIIGATIASAAWALKYNADVIVMEAFMSPGVPDAGAMQPLFNLGTVGILIVTLVLLLTTGVGVIYLALYIIGFVIALVAFLIIYIKMLVLYIRMIVSIITAPLTFTWAVIPGKDDMMINWFKQMAVYTLSLFGMTAAVALTKVAITWLIINMLDAGDPLVGIGSFLVLGPFLIFFIWVYGLNTARKMPEKIEAAIMGPKKK